jgi:type IV secretion system protein VirB11
MNKPQEIGLEDINGHWRFKKDKNLTYSWFKGMATVMAANNGQNFNSRNSIISFKLPEGHRVQIVHGNATKDKFILSIRLVSNKIFSIDDYHIDDFQRSQIVNAVKLKRNLLISGGTSTGKTSFLNMLMSNYVSPEERLVTIEGVSELVIKNHTNIAHLYYLENQNAVQGDRIENAADLLNASLRIRPDRIIMGELRKENSFVFVRAINTGHDGSLATIHANCPDNAICAIKENIVLNGDATSGALDVLDSQLRRNIHGVIQLERMGSGKISGYFKDLAAKDFINIKAVNNP